ncbi:MAG: hypothetical protein B0D91_10805 [Oceanospirillales bacterium LUC14_002_19_P2]|nr:MAG: hypothetical protein B0D91_10805 [Oceanospirillales bacterium LUC14_002_19_P2]
MMRFLLPSGCDYVVASALYTHVMCQLFIMRHGAFVDIANHIGIGDGNNKTLLSGDLTKPRLDGFRHSIE